METTTAPSRAPDEARDVLAPGRPLSRFLWSATAVLVATGTTARLLALTHVQVPALWMVVRMFWLDLPANVPSWFSSVLLFSAAALAWTTASHPAVVARGRGRQWRGVALLAGYVSLDELAQVHGIVLFEVDRALGPGRTHPLVPVVLALAPLLLLGAAYTGFLVALPGRTALGLLASAGLYVAGGVGAAAAGDAARRATGADTVRYVLLTAVEETLELSAAVLLVTVLLAYRQRLGGLRGGPAA